MHTAYVPVAPRGHVDPTAAVKDAVALSVLRLGPDTKAPRLFKQLTQAAFNGGCRAETFLDQLVDRLEIPAAERSGCLTSARAWATRALDEAAKAGLAVLAWFDSGYPPWLGEIPDPPIVLWLRGAPPCLSLPAVAVVGSRRATPTGQAVARELGRDLVGAGFVVVSGLARGIDGAAHLGALDGDGHTVAVLGCGADLTYPPEHAALSHRIAESGAIVSEFPPGMPPLPHHFPRRNRIISGLSRAVVVIEASQKSGSLITARCALEQGRAVLAVPGSVASGRYRGCHALIKDGARLVETVEDVCDELAWVRSSPATRQLEARPLKLSTLEVTMAVGESYSVDDLAERTGRHTADLLAELATLELGGRVLKAAGGAFIRLDKSAIGGERTTQRTSWPRH